MRRPLKKQRFYDIMGMDVNIPTGGKTAKLERFEQRGNING